MGEMMGKLRPVGPMVFVVEKFGPEKLQLPPNSGAPNLTILFLIRLSEA